MTNHGVRGRSCNEDCQTLMKQLVTPTQRGIGEFGRPRWAHNPEITGSNPVPATLSKAFLYYNKTRPYGTTRETVANALLAQLVEQMTLNHRVVGSSPTRRT